MYSISSLVHEYTPDRHPQKIHSLGKVKLQNTQIVVASHIIEL